MELRSHSFTQGGIIPPLYTCDGQDISPHLSWGGSVPSGTRSFALICDDPDAPRRTWVHWILFNIPPSTRELPEHMPTTEELSNGARQGRNDFGKVGYGGPCPPTGSHRYRFTLFALDQPLSLKSGVERAAVENAVRGHVLDQVTLVGHYARVGQVHAAE